MDAVSLSDAGLVINAGAGASAAACGTFAVVHYSCETLFDFSEAIHMILKVSATSTESFRAIGRQSIGQS